MSEQKEQPAQSASIQAILTDLRHFAYELALTDEVVECLLPRGRPHQFETQLWDYKADVPVLAHGDFEEEKLKFKIALCDLMKDVVAFHNSFGGYIAFGISDSGSSRLLGIKGEFDVNDFNKRITAYADAPIECYYGTFDVSGKQIGLLLIPRRATAAKPVKFKKAGPAKGGGKTCFNAEVYVRIRDECRPAASVSEDWQFLHSDRTPPETSPRRARRPVRSTLPARDPDLIEFVGREGQLAELRTWIDDFKSPVRLLTGIGGLGKTTLAYRFSEEVVSTGAGEVEWVIWLSAKAQTFSALKGKMVSLAKVDFTGVDSLYRSILASLHFDIPIEDEEPTRDELLDRLAEAFGFYSCLLVVDDLDSLTPNEQKEAVSGLFGLAMRTVGREQPPVRILLTSRIDQGLPQTAVVKVHGLERAPFAAYVENLTTLFQIKGFDGGELESFYTATSGSPLFASSVVRLVSLGEPRADVIETWRGQDGEDVRRFAFEREITRLDSAQSRLLYAVILLGNTSISDLAEILSLVPKVVRDRISELQSYHLLSTTESDTGSISIVAAGDLSVVSDILRDHLGAHSKLVEDACARAANLSGTDIESIGVTIRDIIALWSKKREAEALIVAEKLRARFPTNGDVLSVLGAAYMHVSPPRWRDADIALESSRKHGCTRPEVFKNLITVKAKNEDWDGLYVLTKSAWSNDPDRDDVLDGFIASCAALVGIAKDRNNAKRAAELTLQVIEQISSKIKTVRLSPPLFERLSSIRYDYARSYINWLDALHPRAGDKLYVFEGVWRLAGNEVYLTDLIRHGISALTIWWTSVENRAISDEVSISILSRQLSRLEAIERTMSTFTKLKPEILDDIRNARRDLGYRGAQLRSRTV